MRQQERKEDAVSPVIGVMLMLVVTIIIAAVITGFATDLSKDTEKAPTAFFDAQYENGKFTLKHKGGDPVYLKDIQLVLEQVGTSMDGFNYIRSGADGMLSVRGDDSATVVTTGDVIQVKDFPINGGTAIWTLTYIPTNGPLANGEVVISA